MDKRLRSCQSIREVAVHSSLFSFELVSIWHWPDFPSPEPLSIRVPAPQRYTGPVMGLNEPGT